MKLTEKLSWLGRQMGSPTITSSAKVVLYSLVERSGPDGSCFPSIARIARDSGLARSSTVERLNELVAAGMIERRKRENPATTIYVIRFGDTPEVTEEELEASPDGGPVASPESGRDSPAGRTIGRGGDSPARRTGDSPAGRTQNPPILNPPRRTELNGHLTNPEDLRDLFNAEVDRLGLGRCGYRDKLADRGKRSNGHTLANCRAAVAAHPDTAWWREAIGRASRTWVVEKGALSLDFLVKAGASNAERLMAGEWGGIEGRTADDDEPMSAEERKLRRELGG